ncbi:MAG: PD-(D/E)XK nuclease family protein, partial [Anaerolineaceae bacterium]
LAELLGGPALSRDLRPLTPWIRAEAVRCALVAHLDEAADSSFARVSAHRATVQSLETTFRDLREASSATLNRLGSGSPRAAEVVAILRRYRALVTDRYYDDTDLAHAASKIVRTGSPALQDFGQIVVYLPRELSAAETALVAALGDARRVTAILGATGDKAADANLRAVYARLSGGGEPAHTPTIRPKPAATHIVAVPDADEEVRSAIRMAMARAANGTTLHRMAFLYPNAAVYGPLVHERLEAAGIPHNGPPVATLGHSIAGRFLLGMLRLPAANFRRDAVMDWLTAGPAVESEAGGFPPTNSWDAITREAGVVAGVAEWSLQLERYARRLNGKLNDRERPASESQVRYMERRIGHVRRLRAFIEKLALDLTPPARWRWEEHGQWARDLLNRYMGAHANFAGCPDDASKEAERDAFEQVLQQIANLEALDAIAVADGARVDNRVFVAALERLLESKAERVGPFGTGIFSSDFTNATGMDFDLVFILGMVEGQMPAIGRDDPLLPDHERREADPSLPFRTARRGEERRSYLAALASAAAAGSERILITSSADLGGQQKRLPSRWLLEAAGELSGAPGPLSTEAFLALQPTPWLTRVASFQSALQGALEPGMAQEYDLRLMLSGPAGRRALGSIETGLAAGMAAALARSSRELGRFDGSIGARPELRPSGAAPTSPTALETWATCPFRYFLKTVLRVHEREDPEDILVLNAAERGTIIHDTLDAFMTANRGWEGTWQPHHREAILEMGDARCKQAESEGITGKPLLWEIERQRILRDLEGFIEADSAQREESGYRFRAGEHSFGMKAGGNAAVPVELPDGSTIVFRGSIDRVDEDPVKGTLAVYDYKTGSTFSYEGLQTDHLKGGQLLQLPIYAMAASRDFGEGSPSVWAAYWFVTRKGEYRQEGYTVTEGDLAEFRRVVEVISDGIRGGTFPANPGGQDDRTGGSKNCSFCPFDHICPKDRQRAWQRKQGSSAIVEYLALQNGGPPNDDR